MTILAVVLQILGTILLLAGPVFAITQVRTRIRASLAAWPAKIQAALKFKRDATVHAETAHATAHFGGNGTVEVVATDGDKPEIHELRVEIAKLKMSAEASSTGLAEFKEASETARSEIDASIIDATRVKWTDSIVTLIGTALVLAGLVVSLVTS